MMKVSDFQKEAVEQKCLRITALHPGSQFSYCPRPRSHESIVDYYDHKNLT